MPTSKETRVRVEGLSKIIARTRPFKGQIRIAALPPSSACASAIMPAFSASLPMFGNIEKMPGIGHCRIS